MQSITSFRFGNWNSVLQNLIDREFFEFINATVAVRPWSSSLAHTFACARGFFTARNSRSLASSDSRAKFFSSVLLLLSSPADADGVFSREPDDVAESSLGRWMNEWREEPSEYFDQGRAISVDPTCKNERERERKKNRNQSWAWIFELRWSYRIHWSHQNSEA